MSPLARQFIESPHVKRVLDQANQDHESFGLLVDDLLLSAVVSERAAVMAVVSRNIHTSHFMRVQQKVNEDADKRRVERTSKCKE
jgi:hypothetical protein